MTVGDPCNSNNIKKSAGILWYKKVHEEILVLLLHPGGPYWKNKDLASSKVLKK